MAILLHKQVLIGAAVAVGVGTLIEGVIIARQWPPPPVKVCASLELGELLAKSAKLEAELREARARLRQSPEDSEVKNLLRLEGAASTAANEVASYKRRAQQQPQDAACR